MVVTKDEVMEQLSRVLSIIPQKYIESLLWIHARLENKNVNWAIGGDLGEQLRTVNVEPQLIEIITSKEGAQKIAEEVKELVPTEIAIQTKQLTRNAIVNGIEYPVYFQSHCFDFNIKSTKVKVYGDLQYRIDSWDWGDKLDFTPEYVYLVGTKVAVVPLALKYEIYQLLGWTDRAEKIRRVLEIRRPRLPRIFK